MSSERQILKRLLEGKVDYEEPSEELDEKTVTVGDKQYWRRSGKCYVWDANSGKKECSEEEYMKAINGTRDAYGDYLKGNFQSEEDLLKGMSKENISAYEDHIEPFMQNFTRRDVDSKEEYEKTRMAWSNFCNTGSLKDLDYVARTVNRVTGSNIKIDTGKTREEIDKQDKPDPKKNQTPNPEKGKKVNYKDVTKIADDAIESFGGTPFDDNVYEFEGTKSNVVLSAELSNHLRSQGYQTTFWTPGGTATNKPTSWFSVTDPKEDRSVDYRITKSTENSAKGKSYLYIDVDDVY